MVILKLNVLYSQNCKDENSFIQQIFIGQCISQGSVMAQVL